MNGRNVLIALLLSAVLLLSGCGMLTVEEMYSPPQRSEDYYHLQSAIDSAMDGLEYCAPLTGENQQTVQTADLDGDGEEEYLIFAKGTSEKPMKILIFRREDETFLLAEVIESQGSAFSQVEYVRIDDQPGVELVVGRQVSDQVLRSVSVYSFASGKAAQLMVSNYSKFLTCDLDQNGYSELMVIQPDEVETENAVATLYSFSSGAIERSREVELSETADAIKRIMVSRLDGGVPAVYVASAVDESAIITDIFAIKNGLFTNISFSNESGTSVQTLRNYYVYADDIDDDGILELPSLITMRSTARTVDTQQYLIRWFAMDIEGREVDKLYTFHNYISGWYIELDSGWTDRVWIQQEANAYTFWLWDEQFLEATAIFSIHALTGSDREAQAVEHNRFVLYRAEGVVYAAKLEGASASFGITQEDLINSFHLIQTDWKTGET